MEIEKMLGSHIPTYDEFKGNYKFSFKHAYVLVISGTTQGFGIELDFGFLNLEDGYESFKNEFLSHFKNVNKYAFEKIAKVYFLDDEGDIMSEIRMIDLKGRWNEIAGE